MPVVTLKGEQFCSRYGASLLQAAGCSNLITNTAEEYVEIAANLAQSPERLLSLRRNLRDIYTKGGLNNSVRFSRSLEQAYVQMVQARTGGRLASA